MATTEQAEDLHSTGARERCEGLLARMSTRWEKRRRRMDEGAEETIAAAALCFATQ